MKYYIRPAVKETELNPVPCGFIIGGAGNVNIVSQGTAVLIPSSALIVGFPYFITFTQMDEGLTTATNIFFLYELD